MIDMIKHAALNTKIRSMQGKMLDKEDYEKLLKLTTVSSVAQFLKEFEGLSKIFSNVNDHEAHRWELEKCLNSQMLFEFKKLYNFSDATTKKFLSYYFFKFELDILKHLARVINAGEQEVYADDTDLFVKKHLNFNISEAAQSKNIAELVNYLSTCKNFEVLSSMMKSKNSYELFDFEMTVDIFFYNTMAKGLKHIKNEKEKKAALEYFGTEVDLMNLKWIYRCKVNFNMDDNIIFSYIIPFYYHISKKTISELVSAKKDDFLKIIKNVCYGDILKNSDFEHEIQIYLKKLYRGIKSKYPYSATSILCYLQLRKNEAANIISIIESIRYNIGSDETRKFLVL